MLPSHQPEIDIGPGAGVDRVRGLCPDSPHLDPADVHCRYQELLWEEGAGLFGSRQAEFLQQLCLDRRHPPGGGDFGRRNRSQVVVEVGNGDGAILGAHRREHLDQHGGRVGRPVAVVPAVERSGGAVHGDVHPQDPAHPEHNLGGPGLVDWPVQEKPAVGSQPILVGGQDLRHVVRAALFLAIQEHLQVDGGLSPRGPKGVERREDGDDR